MAPGPIEHISTVPSTGETEPPPGVHGGRGGRSASRGYELSAQRVRLRSEINHNGAHGIENPATNLALDFKASNLTSVERHGYAMSL